MYEEMEDRIYQHHRLRVLRKRKEYEKYGLVPNYEELKNDPSYSDLRKRVEKEKVIINVIYYYSSSFKVIQGHSEFSGHRHWVPKSSLSANCRIWHFFSRNSYEIRLKIYES